LNFISLCGIYFFMKTYRIFQTLALISLLFLSACAFGIGGGGGFPTRASAPQRLRPSSSENITPEPTLPVDTPTPGITPTLGPQVVKIESIHMLGASNGWAIGQVPPSLNDHILRTSDGGQTWKEFSPVKSTGDQLDLPEQGATAFFLNDNSAWVTLYNRQTATESTPVIVWRTNDGGKTWQSSKPLNTANIPQSFFSPTQIGFSDEKNGWLLAHLGRELDHDYIAIFTTNDGGETWNRVVDPEQDNLDMSCVKNGVTFLNGTNAWVAGDCSGVENSLYLYFSTNGGKTWEPVNLTYPPGFGNVFQYSTTACGAMPPNFLDAKNGYMTVYCMFADSGQPQAWVYHTSNGGANWYPHTLPTPYGAVDFVNPKIGWWLGSKLANASTGLDLYHTPDGGYTWNKIATVDWTGTPVFLDANTGWVVATTGQDTSLLTTSDGGKTWSSIEAMLVH
jgi:photosystem II stability/assembly factor-like uncharacterized protein